MAEVLEVVEPHSLETNGEEVLAFVMIEDILTVTNWEQVLEFAMIEDIRTVTMLLSDHRKDLDINHVSSISNGETPLLAAIRHRDYFAVCELLTHISAGKWPRLSARDHDGNTAIELAAANGIEFSFAQLVERIIAILCCDCGYPARSDGVCGRIAHSTNSERSGWMLEEGPYRYPFKAYCQWGDKLLRRDWLDADTLREIDGWMRVHIHQIFDLYGARVMNEMRAFYWELSEWVLS